MPEPLNEQSNLVESIITSRLVFLDQYETYNEFITAHPTGVQYDCYLVGGDVYIWNTATNEWKNWGRFCSLTPEIWKIEEGTGYIVPISLS